MQYSSDSESDSDSDPQDNSSGIDLETISAIRRIEGSLAHRLKAEGSVLSLAVDDGVVFAGLQGGDIAAWRLDTFELLQVVPAHENSVLSLHLSDDKKLLFSGGADSSVCVWSAITLEKLTTIVSHHDVGDIFCLAYSVKQKRIFCGTQSQSLQWCRIEDNKAAIKEQSASEGRRHRFFDSFGPGELPGNHNARSDVLSLASPGSQTLKFRSRSILASAHNSYVTSLLLVHGSSIGRPTAEVLISGGADGSIKFWDASDAGDHGLQLIESFKSHGYGILALTYNEPFIYAGLTGGQVRVYSLESMKLVQKIFIGNFDVTSIQVSESTIFCGTSSGVVKQFNSQFTEIGDWVANTGKILASAIGHLPDQQFFVSGGNDHSISFWDVSDSVASAHASAMHGNDELLKSLRSLIAYKTVSSQPRFAGECNEAASFLRKLCNVLQAETIFLPTTLQIHPILLAKFAASTNQIPRKRILFYGHYDVVDAEVNAQDQRAKWHSDPFDMTPLDGYLYGRGVSDNKGPIIAALYAAAELVQKKALACDVLFLLEGEEEAGSRGFADTVKENKDLVGKIDHVLIANSYWHDDTIPCLTYGMRGVIHATIRIQSDLPDRHSGMDGKATMHEPLKDLTALLGMLVGTDATRVMVPGFYDGVSSPSAEEERRYRTIAEALMPFHPEISRPDTYTRSLQHKWSQPNLTYHQIETPEPKSAVTIARSAEAPMSIRIVPGQDAATIAENLTIFLKTKFAEIGGSNQLQVQVTSVSDAWLGDPKNEIFSALSSAIIKTWKAQMSKKQELGSDLASISTHLPKDGPLFVREGGSIPAIGFLEKEFDAPAAMFPCGQSSDNAHLDNERIRVENLYAAREVFREVFMDVPKITGSGHSRRVSDQQRRRTSR